MAHLISCQNIEKHFGARTLFENLSFGIEEGERIGLIGPNGAGKSTLMKILTGLEDPDDGNVSRRREITMAYVPQRDEFGDAHEKRGAREFLMSRLQDLGLEEYEKEARFDRAWADSGLPDAEKSLSLLSGGARKRVAILAALVREPDLILFDEPTNHLDLEGVAWLEERILGKDLNLLVITHDRRFLEKVCNVILELDKKHPQGFFRSVGNYSAFLEKREELWAGEATREAALRNTVRREIEWLKRGAKARTTKQNARILRAGEQIDQLEDLSSKNRAVAKVGIEFTSGERQAKLLFEGTGLSKSMGGRPLFSGLDLVLGPGDKLGLLGVNGSGKSTLLRVMAGELEPDAGKRRIRDGLRIVRFEQQRDSLNLGLRLRDALCPSGGDQVIFRDRPVHVTAWARRFRFQVEQLDLVLSKLSGGEQSRVLIAQLMLRPADLLLLDEPTNDLDLGTLEVLEESLLDFPGALVLITHDRYLLERVSDRLLALDGNGKASFHADLDQWQSSRSARRNEIKGGSKSAPESVPSSSRGALTGSERNELKKMEERIAAAEAELDVARKALEDPSVASQASVLLERQNVVLLKEQALAALFERWDLLEKKRSGG